MNSEKIEETKEKLNKSRKLTREEYEDYLKFRLGCTQEEIMVIMEGHDSKKT